MKITRAMVARKAGVSVSTVSYVLNTSRYVSPKLTEKVMAAVEELGYTPDMAARSMVKKRSQILTIIANDLTNSMYGELLMAIEHEAVQRGYFINMCSGQLPLKEYIKSMIGRRVDGVFFASVPDKVTETDINQMLSNDIVVACGNYILPGEKRINRVEVDYDSGIKQAVQHLIGLGHKEIVYLNGLREGEGIDLKCKAMKATDGEGNVSDIDMPETSNALQFFTEDGTKISVRPSGTEPKIKFYVEVKGQMGCAKCYASATAEADEKVEAVKKSLGI